jgi:hypothetical protein
MLSRLRRFAAALVTTFAVATPAAASTTYSTDYSDLWYVATESGWGVNIIQQGQVIFLSLFIYDGSSLPRWYFASNVSPTSTTSWSGPLYRSQGTAFNAPWTPSQFVPTPVGTISLNFSSAAAATMTYTVDNVPAVTKQITRFSFAADNLAGVYLGGLLANTSQCSTNTNGYFIADRLVVDHSVQASPKFSVGFFVNGTQSVTCVFQGSYQQQGRTGTIPNGTWACTGAANNTGTFSMTEIQASQSGISAKFSGKDQYCQSITGFFGGVKDVQ